MCDKIGEMNEYIEHNVFIPFEERYVLDGWLQVYYLCHP